MWSQTIFEGSGRGIWIRDVGKIKRELNAQELGRLSDWDLDRLLSFLRKQYPFALYSSEGGTRTALAASLASATPVVIHFNSFSTPITADRTVDGGLNWFCAGTGPVQLQPDQWSGRPTESILYVLHRTHEFITPGTNVTYDMTLLENGATNIGEWERRRRTTCGSCCTSTIRISR